MKRFLTLFGLMISTLLFGCSDDSLSDSYGQPKCTLSSRLVEFGEVTLGSSAIQKVQISCSEPTTLNVKLAYACDFSIADSVKTITISDINQPAYIDITYTPPHYWKIIRNTQYRERSSTRNV